MINSTVYVKKLSTEKLIGPKPWLVSGKAGIQTQVPLTSKFIFLASSVPPSQTAWMTQVVFFSVPDPDLGLLQVETPKSEGEATGSPQGHHVAEVREHHSLFTCCDWYALQLTN